MGFNSALAEMNDTLEIENMIIAKLLAALLAVDGLRISVNDGEITTLIESTDRQAILDAMRSTDSDSLIVTWQPVGDRKRKRSFVQLIYGNGIDLISDYGISLDFVMISVTEAVNQLEESLA